MFSYKNSRVFFNSIVQKYTSYLILYKFYNNGSLKGCTSFADFYWSQSYFHRETNINSGSPR